MKRLFKLMSFVLLAASAVNVNGQNSGNDVPPYLQYPILPVFNLLTLDSQKVFSTADIPAGKPVLLIMFSPDCQHCEEMTDKIIENYSKLQGVRIFMITPMSLKMTNEFYEKKQLAKYRNIVVAKDFEFFFPDYYRTYDVPFVALYDRNKKFLKAFDQSQSFEKVLESL